MTKFVPRGFTLIEMLIVVAIISIFSAALLAVVTAPAREQALAVADMAQGRGLATFFTALVEDAHSATSLKAGSDGRVIVFAGVGTGDDSAIYFVDESGILHRFLAANADADSFLAGKSDRKGLPLGPDLLQGVQTISAERLELSGLWRVKISAEEPYLRETLSAEREMLLSVGKDAWMGGAL